MALNSEEILFIVKMRDEANKVLKKIGQETKQAGKDMNDFGEKSKRAGANLRTVALQIGAMIGSFHALRGSINVFTEFENALQNVATLIPGQTKRIEDLGVAIRTMAVRTGTSSEVLADGMFQVISAFGDTANSAAVLNAANKASIAGNATVAESVSLLSAVVKGYGTTLNDTTKVFDLAFKTNELGETTFGAMAATMGRVAPNAKLANVSMEELFATIATLTGVTGNTAEVTTQMRQVFLELVKPGDNLAKAFKAMGVSSGEALVKQEGFIGALKALEKQAKASGMKMTDLFSSQESVGAIAVLTGNQLGTYNTKLAEMKRVSEEGGAAQKAFMEKFMTLQVSMNIIRESFKDVTRVVGEGLKPVLAQVALVAQQVGLFFISLKPEFRELAGKAIALGVALGGLVPLLLTLKLIGPSIAGGFQKFAGAMLFAAQAARTLTIALLTTPIGWVVAGVAAIILIAHKLGVSWNDMGHIVGLVVKATWEGIKFWAEAITKTFLALGAVVKGLGSAFANFSGAVVSALTLDFNAASDFGRKAVADMKGIMGDVKKVLDDPTVFSNLGKGIGASFDQLGKEGKDAGKSFLDGFSDELGIGLKDMNFLFDPSKALTTQSDFAFVPDPTAIQGVKDLADAVGGNSGDGKSLAEAAKKAQDEFDKLKDRAKQLIEQTRTPMEDYKVKLDEAKQLLDANLLSQDQYNRVVAAAKDAYASARGGLEAYARDISDFAGNTENAVVNAFKKMEDTIVDFVATGKFNFSDFASSVVRDLTRIAVQATIIKPLLSAFGFSGFFEKGGVFQGGEVQAFASGGIVNTPTLFPMRGGKAGLMGEAGPEAIVPLTRTRNGDLGVKVVGSGGGGGVNMPVEVNVTFSGGGPSNSDQAASVGAEIGRQVRAEVVAELRNQQRPGGLLNRGSVF